MNEMSGIVFRIKEHFDDFNTTEKKIAEYFIEKPDHILRLSITQLAGQIGTSQAAIVRFCKRLGYDGLKDIKTSLADDLLSAQENKEEESYSDIRISDPPNDIIEKVAANHILALEETIKVLDIEEFEKAVDLLSRAHRVDVFGIGASGLVAQDLQQKLTRIDKFCLCYTDVHMQLTAAASLTEKDAAVFISYSGKTREVITCAEAVKDRKTKMIAITKFGQRPLAKIADIVLNVYSPEIAIRSGATSSRITQLAVIDMLFTNVASQHHDQLQEILQRSRTYTMR